MPEVGHNEFADMKIVVEEKLKRRTSQSLN